jgi:hypothetical protein
MGCRTIIVSRHPRTGDPNHCNSPVRFRPYCKHYRVLQPAYGRDRCRVECSVSSPHCILSIPPEQVVMAVLEMLAPLEAVQHKPSARMSPVEARPFLVSPVTTSSVITV